MSYVAQGPGQNLHAFAFSHLRAEHPRMKQRPLVIWMTGISASGKSTIADALDIALQAQGRFTCIVDGDSVRGGLCRDLGFTDNDREENIRRVAEVARLMLEAGLIVIVALISPSAASRHYARSIIGNESFVEVHVDAPLETAEQRDPKGLYKKARAGLIKNFTGIDSRYDLPIFPEVHLNTQALSVEQSVEAILDWVARNDART
ncbi:adenylyl-sulfate kinase [Pseudomonas fluorescens]|jgi:adenylylsulfate kinase|uniref:Adenylyl-sulfate kinase n=1 Tax=Pseudomonas aylmerensis TaxID=1869229 RepID=A0A2T4G281_9PSED|nr:MULTISPECIES: adenylyl-sulfate kinase [Pseudomonas]AYF47913.1 adenylyl-sulfate kinase [Pseudomonas fluorescens]MBK5476282.1 adenylyl-sulfate kinase [Pseudomonas sp. TH21]MBS7846146.1 adenylyl-sulfate kinase [Pseudomonas fluorescens]OCW23218.1 adenylyl-sulfate kinase [Pseudomonas aylmerensis]PTC29791.1 adenylyl-sulfate kinase [Pseudomonas aylmerensis]